MKSVDPQKLAGCIIGQSLGDALGLPVEGHDQETCQDYIDNHVRVWVEQEDSISDEWTGQYTDDSQLARELLISLVENEGWHPVDYASRIAELFRSNRVVGRGIACDNAANRLISGCVWQQAGEPTPSAGNGTAMRAASVGMYYHCDIQRMIVVAHEQGWITHHDPRCSAGSIAIAGAVALALTKEAIIVEEFTTLLRKWTAEYSEEFADLIGQLEEWLKLPPSEALTVIAPAGKTKGYQEMWPGISPFVIPCVLWSLYSFLRHPHSYFDAVTTAIVVGGDVDTTAAMTGAISGAYLGLANIPHHLATRVNDGGVWGYSDLVALANACHEKTAG